ncbi:MAG: hypothetical protein IPN19_11350 [Elusimicrobia bacterium]|nr:hypothetical protein [Elusimicrobiota bacterium]
MGGGLTERVMKLFELQVGPDTRLIRVGLTKTEDLDKPTSTWSNIAHAPLTGTADDSISVGYPLLTAEKIAVFTNGINPIRKVGLTGDTELLGGSPPIARYVRSFGPYLVLAYITDGGNTYYSRVQWCDTGDCETWSGGNAGSTDLLEDPEDITGLGIFGNFLTIHKRSSIYLGQLVTTSDVFRFDRKSTGVGAIAEATISNIPSGEQIFLGADGLHLFNGITAPLIDSPIQDELRETINPSAVSRSNAVYIDDLDEYWVAVPIGSDSDPSTIYKYNWRTRQVYRDDRPDCTAMSLYLNTTSATWDSAIGTWDSQVKRWDSSDALSLNKVLVFGNANGETLKRESGATSDATTAIDALWETKEFTATDFGIPDIDTIMRWTGMELWALGNSFDVSYSTDNGNSWISLSTVNLTSYYPQDDAPLNLYFDVLSSSIRFRFANTANNQVFTIKKYQIEAHLREMRR